MWLYFFTWWLSVVTVTVIYTFSTLFVPYSKAWPNLSLPGGRPLCRGSLRGHPARCSSSSADWVHSPNREPVPARDSPPHVAVWQSAPPALPDSARPGAAARHKPASSAPALSEHWPTEVVTWDRCSAEHRWHSTNHQNEIYYSLSSLSSSEFKLTQT